jgi:hypothetical protein
MTSKRCFKCLCTKPLAEFYRHAAMGDGHLNKCKDCTKADVKERRQVEWEKVRAYDRMRASQPHRVAQAKRIQERWKAEHPERRAAHVIVGNALRKGALKRHPCWVCGEKAEAHHPDYDRPLDVVWLCQPHHKQAHALVANEPAMQEVA